MALKDKLITLEDLKAVHDVDAEEITGVKADLDDLRETNRFAFIKSVTVSGTGAYIVKEIPFEAIPGKYYAKIKNQQGGTSGNFAAYIAAYDSNGTRLTQSIFPSAYPSQVSMTAPQNTVELRLRLFATLATNATASVTFNDIEINKDSFDVDITLSDNVKIPRLDQLEEMISGMEVDGIKVFTGTGEVNLDISVNIENGKTYYITLENTDISGGVQIYGYDGDYTTIKYFELSEENKYAFEANQDFYKIRFHYNITNIENAPSSKATIKSKPIYESQDNNIIHVGNGFEFTDIQDAIDSCPDSVTSPYIIFIHNGEYGEFSTYDNNQRVRYISFIGESRCGVIVRGNKGTYAKPTAEIASFGAVRNMTFIQETSLETQEEEGRFPYCYALHDDYFEANTEYENCTFVSNAGPAVGMGMKANKSKAFRNCTFINNGDGSFGSISIGAFFGHSGVVDNSENQELIIENCTAINETGVNGFYLSLITSVSGATFKGVNIRNSGSFGNGQPSAQCTLPLSYSYGNNVDSLNVP